MSRNLYRINRNTGWHIGSKTKVAQQPLVVFQGGYPIGELVQIESTKLERKLQCALNRISKLIPSVKRISELDRIAVELEAEAYTLVGSKHGDSDGLAADALYLRRLEYDLTSMREAKASIQPKKQSTMKAGSKYEPTQWPRGERP